MVSISCPRNLPRCFSVPSSSYPTSAVLCLVLVVCVFVILVVAWLAKIEFLIWILLLGQNNWCCCYKMYCDWFLYSFAEQKSFSCRFQGQNCFSFLFSVHQLLCQIFFSHVESSGRNLQDTYSVQHHQRWSQLIVLKFMFLNQDLANISKQRDLSATVIFTIGNNCHWGGMRSFPLYNILLKIRYFKSHKWKNTKIASESTTFVTSYASASTTHIYSTIQFLEENLSLNVQLYVQYSHLSSINLRYLAQHEIEFKLLTYTLEFFSCKPALYLSLKYLPHG